MHKAKATKHTPVKISKYKPSYLIFFFFIRTKKGDDFQELKMYYTYMLVFLKHTETTKKNCKLIVHWNMYLELISVIIHYVHNAR